VSAVGSQGREVRLDLLSRDPNGDGCKSNCPVLHGLLEELVELTDAKWRARAQNIYAGRTFSTVDTALSRHGIRGGMIAISSEFTSVMMAYAAMYGVFLSSVDDGVKRSLGDAEAIQLGMRKEFALLIDQFRSTGLLALKERGL